MSEPEHHRPAPHAAGEIRFDCPGCGHRLVAVRGRRGRAAFFAPPIDGDPRADAIRACPRCKRPLPRIAWEAFCEQVWRT